MTNETNQDPPDAPRLCRDQERRGRSSGSRSALMWAHADAKGFNLRLDYLPLNDAEIVVREISDQPQTEGNGAAQ